jgi:hypothetical protein
MAESRLGLVGLAVGGGALALVLIGLAVAVVHAMSSSDAHVTETVTDKNAELATDGMHARGTEELRRLGCDPPIVMDMSRLMGDAAAIREGEPRFVVTCDVLDGGGPSCERVAGTYFAALGGSAAGNVNIRITRPGSSRPVCSHLYAPSGADFGEFPKIN